LTLQIIVDSFELIKTLLLLTDKLFVLRSRFDDFGLLNHKVMKLMRLFITLISHFLTAFEKHRRHLNELLVVSFLFFDFIHSQGHLIYKEQSQLDQQQHGVSDIYLP